MLRRVTLVRTFVSEELSASFIRVTRIGELGITLAVTSNRPYESSAVAEYSKDQGHRIRSHEATIFATGARYMDRIVKEAIEIELHSEGVLCPSK
jgi:hypothetical protein